MGNINKIVKNVTGKYKNRILSFENITNSMLAACHLLTSLFIVNGL